MKSNLIADSGRPAVRTVESLGAVVSAHKPSLANKIAGSILSLLMTGGGLGIAGLIIRGLIETRGQMPLWAEHGWCWFAVVLGSGLALLVLGGGILLFYYVRALFSLEVFICADGFYCVRRGDTDVYAWDEIAAVEETVSHERLPIVKGPAKLLMPKVTSRSYVVKRCDGKELSIDGNVLSRPLALVAPLRAATLKRKTPWKIIDSQ